MIPPTTELRVIRSREEWLSWRRLVLTGSDMAAIAGVSRHRTPLAVFAEKRGVNVFPSGENNYMTRGRWFEWAILAGLRERFPTWRIVKAAIFMVDQKRRLGGTPDFVVIDPERPGYGIVDGKTVSRRVFVRDWLRYRADEDADEIDESGRGASVPIEHQLQVLLYAKLAGASWAAVAPMVVSEHRADLMVLPVELHDGAWARLLSEADFFWREFDAGRRPSYNRDLDGPVLRALYPAPADSGDPPFDLAGHNRILTILEERAALMAAMKAADEEKSRLETDVIALVGDHAVSVAPGGWRIGFKLETHEPHMMSGWSKRVLRITKSRGKRSG